MEPSITEKVILIYVNVSQSADDSDRQEFIELFRATGASYEDIIVVPLRKPQPQYLIGGGKVEELQAIVAAEQIGLLVFSQNLSPAQERNLERALKCRVIDRTRLILDIFASRARTSEGKLQVELAQLSHMATRLVRGWTHLERQKGGIGLRGPGETQLEVDRRLLRGRIKILNQRLQEIKKHRLQGRRIRKRRGLLTVALVGYTNAGKSTLFNRLTAASVYAADQLFATLDPTLRQIHLPGVGSVILADTVGFIRDLPHDLVAAFRATLEEAAFADLLVHVVDASEPVRDLHIEQVQKVLQEIDADDLPQLLFYNKIDRLPEMQPRVDSGLDNTVVKVWGSAQTGAGIDLLLTTICDALQVDWIQTSVVLKPEQAKLRAQLYQMQAVQSEHIDPEGYSCLQIRLAKAEYNRLFTFTD